jgi:hypothetical protein
MKTRHQTMRHQCDAEHSCTHLVVVLGQKGNRIHAKRDHAADKGNQMRDHGRRIVDALLLLFVQGEFIPHAVIVDRLD